MKPTTKTSMSEGDVLANYLRFSTRKREIIELACVGMSNEAIGNKLYITPATVATHLTEIYEEMATWLIFADVKPNRLRLLALIAPLLARHPALRLTDAQVGV